MNIIKSIEDMLRSKDFKVGDIVEITELKKNYKTIELGGRYVVTKMDKKKPKDTNICSREYCEETSKNYCIYISNGKNGMWSCYCKFRKV